MLATRIRTALIILIPVVIAVILGGWMLRGVTLAVYFAVQLEVLGFATAIGDTRRRVLAAASVAIPVAAIFGGWSAMPIALIVVMMVALASEVLAVERSEHEDIDRGTLGALALMGAYAAPLGTVLVCEAPRHPQSVLLWYLFTVIAADTGAYFSGRAWGRRKMAPRISPKKTIAGGIGGIVSAAGISLVMWCISDAVRASIGGHLAGAIAFLAPIGFGVVVGVCAIFGDLVESLLKRSYGVKDSGNLLPGHGGMLDRVDALLYASPVLLLL